MNNANFFGAAISGRNTGVLHALLCTTAVSDIREFYEIKRKSYRTIVSITRTVSGAGGGSRSIWRVMSDYLYDTIEAV